MARSELPANPRDDESQPNDQPSRPRAISTGPPRLTPFRELQLVDHHRDGDPHALTELLQAYQRRVYAVCYRMVRDEDEAADLTQDALVKIIEGLDSYDGRSKLSTWIIRVTINCVLGHLRKKKVRHTLSIDSQDVRHGRSEGEESSAMSGTIEAREPGVIERIEQQEQREGLVRGMMALEPEARAILVLRDMQGLDYEQIGGVLDVPVGTVKSRLFRARAALRGLAEREGVERG